MPRPFKGGKKKSRGRKFRGPRQGPLVLKEENSEIEQLYGKVVSRLGGSPPIIMVDCEDGLQRKCVIRGKMAKKKGSYCNTGDTVLINYNKGLTGGEVEKKYTTQDVVKLKKLGEINDSTFKTQTAVTNNDVVFSNLANDQNADSTNDIDDDIKALTESYLNDTVKKQDDLSFDFSNI
jgi:translation initiation factor IF-1